MQSLRPPRLPSAHLLAGIAALLLLIAGCKEKNPAIQVRGRVLYQGQPLSGGVIMFHPQAGGATPYRPATGAIQSDGRFEMSTFQRGDGVLPGEYRVTIRAVDREPAEDESYDPVWLIPRKYGDAGSSDLTATVPEESRGPVEMVFELDD